MMRVLVCGGRDFGFAKSVTDRADLEGELDRAGREQAYMTATLNRINGEREITVLIDGDAFGADKHAGRWAVRRGIKNEKFPALWRKYGMRAGAIRNQQMLDEGKPDLVVAFPGGRGTADMVRRARLAGVEIIECSPALLAQNERMEGTE